MVFAKLKINIKVKLLSLLHISKHIRSQGLARDGDSCLSGQNRGGLESWLELYRKTVPLKNEKAKPGMG